MTAKSHMAKVYAAAAKLTDARDTLRDLEHALGRPWPSPYVAKNMDALRDAAARHPEAGGVLAIATRAAAHADAEGKPSVALGILAAAVELIETEPTRKP